MNNCLWRTGVLSTGEALRARWPPVLPRRRTAALFWLLLVLVSVGLLEGALWVASIGFLRRSARALVYSPPAVTKEGYSTYLQQRDPVLGWPSPTSFGVGDLDHSGARRTPSFPTPGTACVVAYGDSFTFGTDADNEHAWSNVLSNLLGCRVANFGVPGYGVDQAYLRFEGVTESSSSIALLGIYPDNVLRNLNQYRFFLTGWEVFGLKPRFIWQDSTALVPLPRMSYEEFKAALRDPARGFPHEEFLPGSSFGQIPSRFPLTAHMIRGLFSDNIVLRVRDRPRWVEFVPPSHDSHAFEITLDIVRRFARTAEDREMAPAVILFPSHRSQVGYRETGRSMMSDVQDSIRAA